MIFHRSGSRPPARTLAVFHVAEISGAALSLRERLAWLAEHGAVEVVVPGPGPAADLYADIATVIERRYEALTLPRRTPFGGAPLALQQARDFATFRRLIRSSRPEMVIGITAMLPTVMLAADREGVSGLLHADEVLVTGRSAMRRRAGRILARSTGGAASAIAACSETVAAQYRFAGLRAEVIHPPIPDAFTGGDGPGFRRRNRIPADAPLVLCVGNISEGRGQDILIEAIIHLWKRFPRLRCALVGEAFRRAPDLAYQRRLRELEATVARSAAAPNGGSPAADAGSVMLCGFEQRIADAYAAADVVVNPARDPEAFGRAGCEALAAGRPVVATRVGATPEILSDERTALLVPSGSALALAAAIDRLLSEPELARRIAETGRREVLDRFSPARSLAAFQRLVLTMPRRSAGALGRPVR
jgi:glycosyltransferase involved in cell wall biosynthesis